MFPALCRNLGLSVLLTLALGAGEIPLPGFVQEPRIGRTAFRSYGPDEGLSSMGINQLAQDREGFLWVGTDIGAFRYDGQRFLQLSRREGLPADTVGLLWADPNGGVWVGAGNGLVRVRGTQVQRMEAKTGLPEWTALSMARDDGGRLWIAMGKQGLYREDATDHFVKVPTSPRPWVVAFAPRHGGTLVLGPEDRGIFYAKDGSTQVFSRKDGLGHEPVAALEDGEGRLWVLDKNGLSYKGISDTAFRPFAHPMVATGGQVRTLTGDGKGGLWVATVAGLLHIQGQRYRVMGSQSGLPTQSAATALVDREGSLWVAFGGLYRELGLGAWSNQTTADGLPTDLVWTLLRDAKGRLWAGTERGLAIQDGLRWKPMPGTESLPVFSLIPEPDGGLLASGTGLDIFYVDPAGRSVLRHRLPGLDPLKVGGIKLLRSRTGHIWAAAGNELLRLTHEGRTLKVEARLSPPMGSSISADVLLEDREGRLWIAGGTGLFEFHQGQWRRYGQAEGLLSDALGGLVEAPDGSLLACYRDTLGVTRLRRETAGVRVLQHLREATGELPTDAIFSVHVDRSGRVWLNTNIGAVLLQERGYRTFGRASGLFNQDMVQGAFFHDPKGGVWFGSSGGLVIFDPDRYPWSLPAPKPSLALLRFGTKEFSGKVTDLIRVPPKDNTFEVQLGYLSYSMEKSFRYESRLDGLEEAWRADVIPQARYTALPPGRYQYQVRVSYDGRVGPMTTLDFEVLPRWYQTWVFRILAGLSLIPLIGGISAWRNRRLRTQNERLEALVSARTLQLEQANRQLEDQMLHDPLTGLYNRRFLTLTLPEQMARIVRELEGAKDQVRPFLGGHPMAFLLLDVDHFKRVNDEHGHGAGDQVLVELAKRFREATRDTDTVIRWGGEEFLVVARQLGNSDPATLADRLRTAVESRPFELEGGVALSLTVSVGFCPFPLGNRLPTMAWDKAVMLADRALYAAKRSGRNRWIGLDEGPAFDADELAAFAGHPDIPGLLHRNLLHGLSQYHEVPDEAWL